MGCLLDYNKYIYPWTQAQGKLTSINQQVVAIYLNLAKFLWMYDKITHPSMINSSVASLGLLGMLSTEAEACEADLG